MKIKPIISFIFFCSLTLALTAPASAQKTRNILILHSYHQGLQWTDNISAGIQSEFKSFGKDIELHYEYLDTKRNPGETYFKQIVQLEYHKTKLANIPFELIICADNNAFRFFLENGDELYPDIPMVFCGINDFSPDLLDGHSNITGVAESTDYKNTLDLMLKFHPERKHIVVILDKTPTGIAIKNEFDAIAPEYSDRLEFEYYQDFVLSEIPDRISTLGPGDLIYLLTFNRDKEGNFISYVDGIHMIQKAAKVPIYGSWDFYFGNGIIGGMITSGVTQGQQAAKLAKEILNGTPPAKLPVVTKKSNQLMFDYKQMQEFGIRKTDLPPNSILINLPPPFYDRYKYLIFKVMGLITLTIPLLTWRLLAQKREDKALKKINKELDKRLECALSKVKILSGFLPICSTCKKIRDDNGNWNQLESYIDKNSEARLSHSLCPECSDKLYGDEEWYIEMKKNKKGA